MAAAPSFKPLSMAAVFASKPSLFALSASKPLLFLSSRPLPLLSIRKLPPFHPLVAQTSGWARQDEENQLENEDNEDVLEWQEGEQEEGEEEEGEDEQAVDGQPGAVASAELSEWERGEEEGVESAGHVAEGKEDEEVEDEETYPEPPEEAKLFVGNIPYDMDSEKLAKLFDEAGVVDVAEVIYNRETDRSRGFGFVTMSTVEEAEKAVEMFHRYEINGRDLTVNKASPRGARVERIFEPSCRIYVGNLPWQVDDARLEQVFSEHGKVLDARVVYDRESGRSRGFGFVRMALQSEMDDAIAALDGQSLDGRALRVNVAEERPRRSSF